MPERNFPPLDEASDPYHRLPKRRRRKQSPWQFGMRTLMLLMTGFCVAFTWFHFWGMELISEEIIKATRIREFSPDTSAIEIVPVFFFVTSLVIGIPLVWIVYRLDDRQRFMTFGCLASLGLLLLFGALSIDTIPLNKTEMKFLSKTQVQRITMLLFGCVLPISSLLGWLGKSWASDN